MEGLVAGDSLWGGYVQFLAEVEGSVVGNSLWEWKRWLLEIYLGELDFFMKKVW